MNSLGCHPYGPNWTYEFRDPSIPWLPNQSTPLSLMPPMPPMPPMPSMGPMAPMPLLAPFQPFQPLPPFTPFPSLGGATTTATAVGNEPLQPMIPHSGPSNLEGSASQGGAFVTAARVDPVPSWITRPPSPVSTSKPTPSTVAQNTEAIDNVGTERAEKWLQTTEERVSKLEDARQDTARTMQDLSLLVVSMKAELSSTKAELSSTKAELSRQNNILDGWQLGAQPGSRSQAGDWASLLHR